MNTISSRNFHLRLKSSWAVRAGKRSVKTDEIHARLDQPGSKHLQKKQTNKQYLNGRNREREDHRTGLENVWRVEEFLFYYSTISVAGSGYFFYTEQNSCIWKLKWLPNVHDISVIYCHWNIYISLDLTTRGSFYDIVCQHKYKSSYERVSFRVALVSPWEDRSDSARRVQLTTTCDVCFPLFVGEKQRPVTASGEEAGTTRSHI